MFRLQGKLFSFGGNLRRREEPRPVATAPRDLASREHYPVCVFSPFPSLSRLNTPVRRRAGTLRRPEVTWPGRGLGQALSSDSMSKVRFP